MSKRGERLLRHRFRSQWTNKKISQLKITPPDDGVILFVEKQHNFTVLRLEYQLGTVSAFRWV